MECGKCTIERSIRFSQLKWDLPMFLYLCNQEKSSFIMKLDDADIIHHAGIFMLLSDNYIVVLSYCRIFLRAYMFVSVYILHISGTMP